MVSSSPHPHRGYACHLTTHPNLAVDTRSLLSSDVYMRSRTWFRVPRPLGSGLDAVLSSLSPLIGALGRRRY
ncbi:hypothetical protein CesoFtcFv8_023566 [Champsocephalus esox]|nr:hypothetical protein CesoFtcFv8_023566 [Champsocephalus esox]